MNMELLQRYIEVDDNVKDLEKGIDAARSEREKLRVQVIEFLRNTDIDKISAFGKTFSVHPKLVTKIENEEVLFAHLETVGDAGIIRRVVPWQTLTSYVKELYEQGKTAPPGVNAIFIDNLYVRKT